MGNASKFEKRKKKIRHAFAFEINVPQGNFTLSLAGTAKKLTKKRSARAKYFVVLLINLLFFDLVAADVVVA